MSLFKPHISGKGLAWNTLIKILTISFTVLIEFFYAKFLLLKLGTDFYGLIALTTNTIQIASILTYLILTTMGRFESLSIYRGDNDGANQVFNVALFSIIALSVCFFLPVFSIISLYAPKLFLVPFKCETATQFLFAASLFSFLLTSIGSVLSIGTFVHNRLDIVDLLNFSKILISRGSAVILICFAGFGIYGVGGGLIIASLMAFMVSFFLKKQLSPDLILSRKFWNSDLFSKMVSFSSWMAVRQLGGRALTYLDIIVVNRLYGPTETGLYGIAFFFSSNLRVLTGTFFGLFNPIIINRYAKGDIDGMLEIACRGMNLIGIIFALPVGLLCGLYKPIFTVWVGREYEHLYLLALILTIHISVNTATYLLSSILSATNNVKVPGIVSIGFAIANVILAVILGWPSFGIGVIGVAIAGMISLTCNNVLFTPYYVGRILNRSPKPIYKTFVPGIAGLLVCFSMSLFFSQFKEIYTLPALILIVIIISVLFSLFGWFFLINHPDRKWILSLVLSRLNSN